MGKDNYKMRREPFKFWDWVRLILDTLRYAETDEAYGKQTNYGRISYSLNTRISMHSQLALVYLLWALCR